MMSSFLSPPMSETTLEGCWHKELTLLLCCSHQKDDWRRNGVWQRLFLLYPSNPENKGRFFRHNLERLKEWIAIWDLGWKEQGSMLASVFCRSSSAAKTIDIFFFPQKNSIWEKQYFFMAKALNWKQRTCILFATLVSDTLCDPGGAASSICSSLKWG